jgi:hypothetical protein
VLPFYEPEASQREVISVLQRDQRVTAVLMSFPGDFSNNYQVATRDRVPLVWAYVQKNFEPAFSESGVEFWRRRQPASELRVLDAIITVQQKTPASNR